MSKVRVVVGVNDLKTKNPSLCDEWNYQKNKKDPEAYSYGSGEKVWWKCNTCGYEWEATIVNRNKGRGCPCCAGKAVCAGINDLETTHPDTAKLWDYEKNGDLTPKKITAGSNKKVCWHCSKCGYEWPSAVCDQVKRLCPVCDGRKVKSGYNDLATLYPTLMDEWAYDKNKKVDPTRISTGSGRKVWWICKICGYEWNAPIYGRTSGKGCPACSGRVIRGSSDSLETLFPVISSEWDYEKNKGLKPLEISPKSGRSVWWKCSKCGHQWKTSVANRTSGHTACPNCNGASTSFAEQAVLFYIRKTYPDAINRDTSEGFELDIFIPSIRTAIEYDGKRYHNNEKKQNADESKNKECENAGIRLIRIREKGLPVVGESIIREDDSIASLNICIVELMHRLGVYMVAVDVKSDIDKIYGQYYNSEQQNSLAVTYPELLSEWAYDKNGNLNPERVSARSNLYAWWRCAKGHEWNVSINSRTTNNTKCPYCANRKLLSGFNDLATTNPELAKEWNYDRNGDLNPQKLMAGSSKKVWWKCSLGHEWPAQVNNRNQGGGCPYCAGRKVLAGYNDLATLNPSLAKEWDYEKNGELLPSEVALNSNKKVWWVCPNGHEYTAIIANRSSKKSGCPYCAGKRH